ncbi:MAG: NAD(P)H-binding protein [Proteobacteria bacterium]|nr:NAD(P)H-binding protein [Pseudomonadota bacterium]
MGRRALVAGATGLVGRELLAALLADSDYAEVLCIGRRAPAVSHAKLACLSVDFSALPPLPRIDDCYVALGTTIKVAGSQAAFRAVDFDAVVATAKAARASGAMKLGVISAMGADPRSRLFYSRVKGEMEQAVAALGYESVVIVRPSFLAGDRSDLAQPPRLGERWVMAALQRMAPLIPVNYRAISPQQVARALLASVKAGRPGVQRILSGQARGF